MRIGPLTPLSAVVAALAAIVVALGAAAPAAAANSFGADMFGISVGGDVQGEDSATLGRDLDAIDAVGASWVRIDINWGQIQAGGPTSYNWTAIDRVVQGATARGMKVLGIIAYTPGWARPSGTNSHYGPDPVKYAAFANRAVAHYSAMGVHTYEVWNEPNFAHFWTPAPDPAAYTRLLKLAYPAIKAADPQATVLSGGTAPVPSDGTNLSPVDFLQGIYANGGGGFFDAVSHHPYTWTVFPGDPSGAGWHQMYGTSPSLRSVMTANGDGAKKIWGTEFGSPTNGAPGSFVSEEVQAQMISKAYSLWKSYDWAGPLFTYEGRDLGTSAGPAGSQENFFGLLRHDFSQKPAYAAYRAAVEGGTDPGPPPGGGDGATAVNITIRVRGNGGPSRAMLTGMVSTMASGRAESGAAPERLELKLYRDSGRSWRTASRWLETRLVDRRFQRTVTRLRPGTYHVRARYVGSQGTSPSTARSRNFLVRP